MPKPFSQIAVPPLPGFLALVRLPDGSGLARLLPAWALSPSGKIDFRNSDDMLDLLDTACDDIDKAMPGMDLDSGSVYGFVQGPRKLAVATLLSEPLDPEQAEKLLSSFPNARHASPLIRIAALESGPNPLSKERSINLTPGLEPAFQELDFIGQARHYLMEAETGANGVKASPEQIRQVGLSFLKERLAQQREERMKELQERRELISQLKELDLTKTPLAVFLPAAAYTIAAMDAMMEEFITHAIAIPLSELLGEERMPTGTLRPKDLPTLSQLVLERAQQAWSDAPSAKDSCLEPDAAQCAVMDHRLIVTLPLNQNSAAHFPSGIDFDQAGAEWMIRRSAWIMGLAERVAVSGDVGALHQSQPSRLGTELKRQLKKDDHFWSEINAMDISQSMPALGASSKRTPAPAL